MIFHLLKNLNLLMIFNVQCTICHGRFSVSHGGRSAINSHLKMQKHKIVTRSLVQSDTISNHLSALVPSENDFLLAVRKATFVYHTVIHSQSFCLMSCTNQNYFVSV